MKIKHKSHFQDINTTEFFGILPDNKAIHSYKLTNKNGMQATIIDYGATVTALKVPRENGELVDVVLGFDSLEKYLKSYSLSGSPYFGATVGRYAGRINNGTFTLNDKTFHLNKNNNNHSLHGGIIGFAQKKWEVETIIEGENPSITMTLLSPDNEENYPGDLSISLTYTLSEDNELQLEYTATTTKDTIINLTHHSYFNLNGHDSSVADQEMIVNSDKILETTPENIPTGTILNLTNHVFDFRTPANCPTLIDNSFIIETESDIAAALYSPTNGLRMTVYTNQPSVHVFVGGNCGDIKGKENVAYHSLSGICFETQNYPDAPNHSHFPNSILKKEDTYQHKTVYKFQSI
ncbi:galactose mutarotase [Flavobacterium sp. LS1R49]|uniref:Aldose 1-epimerase n=1 Tax=Flavobacterium shii TaxID=2987687 RepID=A0A9X3C7X1_9FLAO|nr:aldose epimerase family protein [Flavobacterium shii]MCV9929593.1 galactose mutarotase [Flavobacterium shii]